MKTNSAVWNQFLIVTTAFCLSCCHSAKEDPQPEHRQHQNTTAVKAPDSQPTGCVVSLLGDKDGFGMGLPDGGTLSLAGGTPLPLDHRGVSDPRFTDLYPADMADGKTVSHRILYTHEFSPFPSGIDHATLHLNTLGIQDGDSQVYGLSTDIKLFLDNEEVPNAFDEVDQFDMINGAWSDFASHIDIKIPANLLHVLLDGKVEVRWELYSYGINSNSSDSIAIDYSELEICSNSK